MTKIAVWNYIDAATTNYHSGGGVAIISDGDYQAAWDRYKKGEYTGDTLEATLPTPDFEATLAEDQPEQVTIFADAGCC